MIKENKWCGWWEASTCIKGNCDSKELGPEAWSHAHAEGLRLCSTVKCSQQYIRTDTWQWQPERLKDNDLVFVLLRFHTTVLEYETARETAGGGPLWKSQPSTYLKQFTLCQINHCHVMTEFTGSYWTPFSFLPLYTLFFLLIFQKKIYFYIYFCVLRIFF